MRKSAATVIVKRSGSPSHRLLSHRPSGQGGRRAWGYSPHGRCSRRDVKQRTVRPSVRRPRDRVLWQWCQRFGGEVLQILEVRVHSRTVTCSHKFAAALACARGTCPRLRSMASRLARRRVLATRTLAPPPRRSRLRLRARLPVTSPWPAATSSRQLWLAPHVFSNPNVPASLKESCPHH